MTDTPAKYEPTSWTPPDTRQGLAANGLTLEEMLPRIIVPPWRDVGVQQLRPAYFARRFYRGRVLDDGGVNILVTLDYDTAAGLWMHASVSTSVRLPTWDELVDAKRTIFLERPVVQLLPPRAHWLNAQPYVLHLWERLDGDVVPEALWRRA